LVTLPRLRYRSCFGAAVGVGGDGGTSSSLKVASIRGGMRDGFPKSDASEHTPLEKED
jgi:hypothetical protein